ncbi:MAG: glutathione S-transferase family protein [Myxococcaceae bacterium]
MPNLSRPIVHHIPVCPFSQRLEILLALKGLTNAVEFRRVDITRPRNPELLAKTRGTTALPVLETESGEVLKESLVLMDYLEHRFPEPAVAQEDPYARGVERLMSTLEGPFVTAGYRFILNQEPSRRDAFAAEMLAQYAKLEDFLQWKSPNGTFLFDRFGWAEAVFTPMFMRFWFLDYYEGFELPSQGFERVRRWRDACLEHPAAQQVSREEIVKLYYDYAKGRGNGSVPEGRTVSSFNFEPHWSKRPWPPADKYGKSATDAELGLV